MNFSREVHTKCAPPSPQKARAGKPQPSSFKYNADGLRTEKTVNGETTKYIWDGDKLVCQQNSAGYIWFSYNQNGELETLNYNGGYAFVLRNLQGDVIALEDQSGTVVAKYSYDSWGNVLSVTDRNGNAITNPTHMANQNPMRYRGYYYDTETGFYYLQSRYYDPVVGRFLNADVMLHSGHELFGHNMFGYCNNNPIKCIDPSGTEGFVIGGVLFSAGQALAFAALLVFTVAYALNVGGFRTTVNNAVAWAISKVVTSITTISNQFSKLGKWASGIIASLVAAYMSATATQALPGIARKYGLTKCKEAADAMKKELVKRKLPGATVDLYFPKAYRGFVVSDRKGGNTAISENGHHFGIYYKGVIYCNIYPEGLPANIWPTKFHAFSDVGRSTTYFWF